MVRGSVTVFFSLVFTVVLALICTVIESARMHTAGVRAKSITYMAMESEFAGYSKQVFDDYGVLLLWHENGLNEGLENYIRINNGDINNQEFSKQLDILQLSLKAVEENKIKYATDNGGDEFVKQILEYEKIAAGGDIVAKLLEYFQSYQENVEFKQNETEIRMAEKAELVSGEDIKILQDMALEYQEAVKKLQSIDTGYKVFKRNIDRLYDRYESDNGNFKKSEIKKLIKYFNRLKKKLKYIVQVIDETIIAAEEYIQKKYEILKKYDIKSNVKEIEDYIEKEKVTLQKEKTLISTVIKAYLESGVEKFERAINSNNLLDKEALRKELIIHIDSKLAMLEDDICLLTNKNEIQENDKYTNLFEQARSLLKTGVLELVIPSDTEISSLAILNDNLPTSEIKKSKEGVLENIVDKALFVYYISNHFNDFSKAQTNNSLQYEMEYILRGNYNDKDNLIGTVGELVTLRQLLNTIYMLSDIEKMSTCTQAAATISLAIGLPFLQSVIKIVLMQAWALAESVCDVKALLAGKEVPLIKKYDDWNTSFGNLTDIRDDASANIFEVSDNKFGVNIENDASQKSNSEIILFNYKTYLQILMLLKNNEELIYRTMDLIQTNVNKKYNDCFKMTDSITSAEINVTFRMPAVFTMLPFVQQFLNSKMEMGLFRVNARYGYIY